jgi:hypothetical protein
MRGGKCYLLMHAISPLKQLSGYPAGLAGG